MAALQALSAAWAIVPAAESLRSAALTLGYAALVVAGATQPAQRIAALIVVAAGVTGLMGIVSAALYSRTFAERIEGGLAPRGAVRLPAGARARPGVRAPSPPDRHGARAAGARRRRSRGRRDRLGSADPRRQPAHVGLRGGRAGDRARACEAPRSRGACDCDLRRRRDRLPRAAGRLDVALRDRRDGWRPRGRRRDRGPCAPLGARAQAVRRNRAEPRPPREACARRRRGYRSRRRAGRPVQRRRAERPAVRVAPELHARADVDVERLLPHRGQTAPPGLRGRLLLRSDREPPTGPRARHALRARLSARAVGRDGDRGSDARACPLRRRRPRPMACARLPRLVAPRAGRRRIPAREPRRLAVAPGRRRGARNARVGRARRNTGVAAWERRRAARSIPPSPPGGLTPARARRP